MPEELPTLIASEPLRRKFRWWPEPPRTSFIMGSLWTVLGVLHLLPPEAHGSGIFFDVVVGVAFIVLGLGAFAAGFWQLHKKRAAVAAESETSAHVE